MIEDRLLDVKQVAKLCGCCVSWIWKLTKDEKFPKPVKMGSLTRWRMSQVQEFIASLES